LRWGFICLVATTQNLIADSSWASNPEFNCSKPQVVQKFSDISTSEAKSKIQFFQDHLEKIAERRDFEISPVAAAISELLPIGESLQLNKELRSEAYRLASGFYGRISDQKRDRQGAKCGGTAIQLLVMSLELWPSNHAALTGYLKAMAGICIAAEKYSRFFIEFGTHLDLRAEARRSQEYLRKNPYQNEQPEWIEIFENCSR
jgi:hypothetical protein